MKPSYFVYSTKNCAYCPAVMKYLNMKGIDYTKVELDDNPTLRQELFDKTGLMTVPVTKKVYDGKEEFVVGYKIDKLAELIA